MTMEYIIFDLEFNQGFDKKLNKTVSNEKCPFEIIQIGAITHVFGRRKRWQTRKYQN